MKQEKLSSHAEQLMDHISGIWPARAIYVAAELSIAELLENGPLNVEELAEKSGTHAPSLGRLLKALTTIDICTEHDDGSFGMTPTGALLRAGHPDSLRSSTIWWGTQLWQDWGGLLHSIRTGHSVRSMNQGEQGFDFLKDPQAAEVFNRAMLEMTRLVAEQLISTYDFSQYSRVTDVGGGYGQFLMTILESNPTLEGVLFDLPDAVGKAKEGFIEKGLESRVSFVGGDFFVEIPPGSDAYILKSVIHDWNECKSREILVNCHKAMVGRGKLLLIERVLPEKLSSTKRHRALARIDLTMLVAHVARERTAKQLSHLLTSAGFRIARFVEAGDFCIIEATPEIDHNQANEDEKA